ncbi:MAG: glycosyltransferase [Thermodesulfobacteriota bacterium]|nr:glycosyltransferase [Thermodesulfobacteriota bacterium]
MTHNTSNSQLDIGPPLDGHYVRGRVSVIIPTFNYGNFLLDAVQSAFRQRVRDLEIIVVDDGSTDQTPEILGPYRKRLKYIYQKNAGLSAARNTGMAHSTGEFILFLDADDVLGPNSIALHLRHLDRHPDIYIVVCRSRFFKDTTSSGHPICYDSRKIPQGNLDLHICYSNIAPPHAFLCRRQAITETGWFDTQLKACEDYDFWLRAAVKGFVPHCNPLPLVYYRRHEKSMSADRLNQYCHDAILHKRLSALLHQFPEYPSGRRLEGLMAFSAGALLTAARLYAHQVEGTQDLLEVVFKVTQEARERALSGKSDWNIFMKLYCFKIFSFLVLPCFSDFSIAGPIRSNLKDVLAAVKAPPSRIDLLADAFRSSLSGPHRYLWERWQLAKLSIKYLRNRFLPFGRFLKVCEPVS